MDFTKEKRKETRLRGRKKREKRERERKRENDLDVEKKKPRRVSLLFFLFFSPPLTRKKEKIREVYDSRAESASVNADRIKAHVRGSHNLPL